MKRVTTFFVFFIFIGLIAYAQQATTGIKVKTAFGGTLFLDEKELTSLFDNDTYTIPIEKPGTYAVKMKFANGNEATKSVVISSRGITEIGFLFPPNNIQVEALELGQLQLYWESSGTGSSYNVYYNNVNHFDSAKSVQGITTTSTTLKGLIWNSTYYVWISVTEGGTEGIKSEVKSKKLKELSGSVLGQTGPGGGIIFYDKGEFSDGWQYLEVAPASTEFKAEWSSYRENVPGTREEVGMGKSNTQILVNYLLKKGERGKAAQLCTSLNYNGYDDWFLPSKDELNFMYVNLKQRGNFFGNWYWSSSEYYGNVWNCAWKQNFSNGEQSYGGVGDKDQPYAVRAIRQF